MCPSYDKSQILLIPPAAETKEFVQVADLSVTKHKTKQESGVLWSVDTLFNCMKN